MLFLLLLLCLTGYTASPSLDSDSTVYISGLYTSRMARANHKHPSLHPPRGHQHTPIYADGYVERTLSSPIPSACNNECSIDRLDHHIENLRPFLLDPTTASQKILGWIARLPKNEDFSYLGNPETYKDLLNLCGCLTHCHPWATLFGSVLTLAAINRKPSKKSLPKRWNDLDAKIFRHTSDSGPMITPYYRQKLNVVVMLADQLPRHTGLKPKVIFEKTPSPLCHLLALADKTVLITLPNLVSLYDGEGAIDRILDETIHTLSAYLLGDLINGQAPESASSIDRSQSFSSQSAPYSQIERANYHLALTRQPDLLKQLKILSNRPAKDVCAAVHYADPIASSTNFHFQYPSDWWDGEGTIKVDAKKMVGFLKEVHAFVVLNIFYNFERPRGQKPIPFEAPDIAKDAVISCTTSQAPFLVVMALDKKNYWVALPSRAAVQSVRSCFECHTLLHSLSNGFQYAHRATPYHTIVSPTYPLITTLNHVAKQITQRPPLFVAKKGVPDRLAVSRPTTSTTRTYLNYLRHPLACAMWGILGGLAFSSFVINFLPICDTGWR